ncbi:MAG: extracellular solute-binding protein, partial [Alphaproteobacteria bacterium]
MIRPYGTARIALALAGMLAAATAGATDQVPPKPRQIVFNGAGGETMQKTREVFFTEFERLHGIRVVESTPVNFAKLRAMVDSGNIEWTVAEIGGEDAIRAERMDLFEPVDRKIVPVDEMAPQARERKMPLARSVYSTVLAYRKDAFKDGVYPAGWKDFWDVRRFP